MELEGCGPHRRRIGHADHEQQERAQHDAAVVLTQDGTGKPWATIESLAAVALKAPFATGYRIAKMVTPVDPAVKGMLSRGDTCACISISTRKAT